MVFYPGDETPVCTRQLQDLQSPYLQFQELGAEVFGVNPAEAASTRPLQGSLGSDFRFSRIAAVRWHANFVRRYSFR